MFLCVLKQHMGSYKDSVKLVHNMFIDVAFIVLHFITMLNKRHTKTLEGVYLCINVLFCAGAFNIPHTRVSLPYSAQRRGLWSAAISLPTSKPQKTCRAHACGHCGLTGFNIYAEGVGCIFSVSLCSLITYRLHVP